MGIRYYLNGREVTKAELDAHCEPTMRRTDADLKTVEGRKGLANALARDTQAWEAKQHEACGVPAHCAAERAAEVKALGLSGVEVQPNGNVVFKGPRNKDAYFKAYNLGDFSSAGSGSVTEVSKPAKRKEKKNVDRATLRRKLGAKYDQLQARVANYRTSKD